MAFVAYCGKWIFEFWISRNRPAVTFAPEIIRNASKYCVHSAALMECDDAVNALHVCKCSEYLNKQNEPGQQQQLQGKIHRNFHFTVHAALAAAWWCRALRKPDHNNNNTLKCTQYLFDRIEAYGTHGVGIFGLEMRERGHSTRYTNQNWPKICIESSSHVAPRRVLAVSFGRYDCIWIWPWYLSVCLMMQL